MGKLIRFLLIGPNNDLNTEIDKIVAEHEVRNPRHKAILKIINSTTENCAPGTTNYTYSIELIHFDDLEEENN